MFPDRRSAVWEEVWGDHLHHGYYPGGKPRSDHQQAQARQRPATLKRALARLPPLHQPPALHRAQVDMIDEVLNFAGVTAASRVVDVGCGIGGSSRHIARKFGAAAQGITLSPLQAGRATALTAAAGLSDRVSFQA